MTGNFMGKYIGSTENKGTEDRAYLKYLLLRNVTYDVVYETDTNDV